MAAPDEIEIYPKNFAGKEQIIRIIDQYNADMTHTGNEGQVIRYTDMVGTLMSSVTEIIDIISYVLIAFVAISLVVSSIMIGVITYISVLERRKEIGILRAIGASKRNVSEVLRRAELPEDLFSRKDASLTSEEYLRFMKSIGRAVQDTDIPIRLATTERIETVNPPIFAAYCSQDARHCIKRLAQYKALARAVSFEVQEDDTGITVVLRSAETDAPLPEIIVGIEMVLLINLIRKATQEHIVPTAATVQSVFVNPAYKKFLSRTAAIAQQNSLTFSQADAEIPYIT